MIAEPHEMKKTSIDLLWEPSIENWAQEIPLRTTYNTKKPVAMVEEAFVRTIRTWVEREAEGSYWEGSTRKFEPRGHISDDVEKSWDETGYINSQ